VTRTLVILQAYDPSGPSVRTLYLTNGTPFITGPSETPASQAFAPVLAQPLDVRRRLQGLGASRPTLGEIRVNNQDGTYDAWLGYAFDGRSIVVRTGPDSGAYPSAYPVTFTGQIDRCDVQGDQIVLRVRDVQTALDTPLQTATFAGDNVPPDGLEGGDDLEGQPKPRIYGRVQNAPMPQVNAAKLIYQVNAGAVQSVDDVFDNGVALGAYAPVDWTRTNSTIGGYCAATDGSIMVVGDTTGGTAAAIRTTTDGASFSTIGSLPFTSAAEVTTGMAYSSALDRFVAVTGCLNNTLNTGGEIATSDDAGTTWTIRTSPSTLRYNNVRWCPRRDLFIALGNAGEIHTSPTGVTWTAQTSGTTARLTDVAVGWARLVAVGSGGVTTRSFDGVTWGVQLLPYGRIGIHQHNGWYITGGSAAGRVFRSRDGDTWVDAFAGGTGADGTLYAVASTSEYLVGLFAVSNADYSVCFSVDNGVTWTATAANVTASFPLTILPFQDRWFVFSNNDTDKSGGPGTFANLTELEDDTLQPVPGTYKWVSHATGSYVRLGTIPFGQVTVDARTGATAANRTAAQLIQAVLVDAGYTSAIWNAADMTALDTADASELGLVLTGDETVAEAIDAIATSVGAWWGIDASGVLRVQQLTAPSGSSTFTITANDILGNLERLASSDPLLGLPSTRTTLRYARTDTLALDGAVLAEDAAVLTAHLLAGSTDEDTLYTSASAAQTEANRRQTLRGVQRSAFRVVVPMHDTDRNYEAIALGAVGTLQHPRFGLSGGVLVRVIGIEPNAAQRQLTLTLWR